MQRDEGNWGVKRGFLGDGMREIGSEQGMHVARLRILL